MSREMVQWKQMWKRWSKARGGKELPTIENLSKFIEYNSLELFEDTTALDKKENKQC